MLECVCGYVSNQVEAFDWPDSEVMFHQYLTMMCLWWKLGRDETVAAKLWGPAGVDTRSDATQTPSRHTGTAIEHIVLWKEWWRITHVQKEFCPDGLEGAFALYHFMGSLGLSEAMTESICSTLGRQASNNASQLSLQRVIEKTMLCRGTSMFMNYDDLFILRVWAEYFGGLQPHRFKFVTGRPRARASRYPLGMGSSVIHRHLKRMQKKGNDATLKSLPRVATLKPKERSWGARKWLRLLRK